jgi:hypothetical protein
VLFKYLIPLLLIFVSDAFAFQLREVSCPSRKPCLSLVFIGLNCPSQALFLKDIFSIEEKLSATSPFDEFRQCINSYSVEMGEREGAVLFKRSQGTPPIKVKVDFLEEISKTVDPAKMVFIDYQGSASRAELSLPHITSLMILGRARYAGQDDFVEGFLHELGHSLGLRDESSDAHAKTAPAGYPNCARSREEAQKWWGDLTGKDEFVDYINGCCGSRDYIRPTIASLMNDTEKAEDFGPVNRRYLRKVLRGESKAGENQPASH